MYRTVVITGASSGIGEALAIEMAPISVHLVLVARRHELLQALSERLRIQNPNLRVTLLLADLSKEGGAELLWRQYLALNCNDLDVWVNNAGFGSYGPFVCADLERDLAMLSVNVSSLTSLSKFALQDMVQRQRGHLLNVASVAAWQPGPGMAVYYATKAYVLRLTQALSQEMRHSGVLFHSLCPGNTSTAFHAIAGTSRSKLLQRMAASSPQQVARAAVQGMQANRDVIFASWLDRLLTTVVEWLPAALVVRLSERVLKT